MNHIIQLFDNLEYLSVIYIQYLYVLSNITTLDQKKQHPNEVIDVRFGRSTKQIITNQFIITSKCQ